MNAYERAIKFYQDHDDSFFKDLAEYQREHYAFVTPKYVLLAKQYGQGWFVQFAIGEGALQNFLEHIPYELPYVGWSRDGGETIRWYDLHRIQRAIKEQNARTIKSGISDWSVATSG